MTWIVDRKKYDTFWRFLFQGRYRGGAKRKYMPIRASLFFVFWGIAMYNAPIVVPSVCFGTVILLNLVFTISAIFSYFSKFHVDNGLITATILGKRWFSFRLKDVLVVEKTGWINDAYRVVIQRGIVRIFVIYYSELPEELAKALRNNGICVECR